MFKEQGNAVRLQGQEAIYISLLQVLETQQKYKKGIIERQLNFQTLGQECRSNWNQALKCHVSSLSLYLSISTSLFMLISLITASSFHRAKNRPCSGFHYLDIPPPKRLHRALLDPDSEIPGKDFEQPVLCLLPTSGCGSRNRSDKIIAAP